MPWAVGPQQTLLLNPKGGTQGLRVHEHCQAPSNHGTHSSLFSSLTEQLLQEGIKCAPHSLNVSLMKTVRANFINGVTVKAT